MTGVMNELQVYGEGSSLSVAPSFFQAGRNRAVGHCQIDAADDMAALNEWLRNFLDRPRTFANYRKECDRLLVFAIRVVGRSISDFSYSDCQSFFQDFLVSPPAEFIGEVKAPAGSDEWRPFFRKGLAAASVRQARLVINALFSWLVSVGYLRGNPVGMIRSRKRRESKPRKVLSRAEFAALMYALGQMPRIEKADVRRHERAVWLVTLLYLTGMRISEVVENTMGALRHFDDGAGRRWMLVVSGKGGKEREIPAPDELVVAMRRYRLSCGLVELPSPGERTPLFLRSASAVAGVGRQQIHAFLKSILRQACGFLSVEHAAAIKVVSAHWLRHTYATEIVNSGVDLRHAQRVLGHDSIDTTMIYQHTEAQDVYDAVSSKIRMPVRAA